MLLEAAKVSEQKMDSVISENRGKEGVAEATSSSLSAVRAVLVAISLISFSYLILVFLPSYLILSVLCTGVTQSSS